MGLTYYGLQRAATFGNVGCAGFGCPNSGEELTLATSKTYIDITLASPKLRRRINRWKILHNLYNQLFSPPKHIQFVVNANIGLHLKAKLR